MTIFVKSYPQSDIVFIVEYSGKVSYGLVNLCFNINFPPNIISSHCNPSVTADGTVYVTLPHNNQQSCYVEIAEMPSDYSTTTYSLGYECPIYVIHPVVSSFNTSLLLFPTGQQCCGISIFYADQPETPENGQYTPLCSGTRKTVFTPSFIMKLEENFYIPRDGLHCGIKITLNTIPAGLHDICLYIPVNEEFYVAGQSGNQALKLTLEPMSRCSLIKVRTNYSISLAIRHPKLGFVDELDMHDMNVVTEFHGSFYGTDSSHPIGALLEWSEGFLPILDINEEMEKNCSWKLNMSIREDAHLDLADSVTDILREIGVSITLRTVNAKHAFTISYERKIKKQIMRQAESVSYNSMHSPYCFHQRCYIGIESSTENVSWWEAHNHCQARGHHLLSINSENEWLQLSSILFYQDRETRRCTNLAMIFLGLRNQKVGIACQCLHVILNILLV